MGMPGITVTLDYSAPANPDDPNASGFNSNFNGMYGIPLSGYWSGEMISEDFGTPGACADPARSHVDEGIISDVACGWSGGINYNQDSEDCTDAALCCGGDPTVCSGCCANSGRTLGFPAFCWPVGDPGAGAGQDAITCVTCHDVHGGIGGQMAVRDVGQGTSVICAGCHAGGEGPGTARNSHHLTGAVDYTGAPYNFTNPTWAAAAGAPGDLADGLACHDCHIFNDTAHNW